MTDFEQLTLDAKKILDSRRPRWVGRGLLMRGYWTDFAVSDVGGRVSGFELDLVEHYPFARRHEAVGTIDVTYRTEVNGGPDLNSVGTHVIEWGQSGIIVESPFTACEAVDVASLEPEVSERVFRFFELPIIQALRTI